MRSISELRQDPIIDDWVVIATGRAKRPNAFIKARKEKWYQSKKDCPFEDPQKSGNPHPLLIYYKDKSKKDWSLQVVQNKFPAFGPGLCEAIRKEGPYTVQDGVGFHEVIITRDHNRQIAQFSDKETEEVIHAYQERYLALMDQKCVKYISIFHNQGKEGGATMFHPHSQLVAIPVIPANIKKSLDGAKRFFQKNKKCVYCTMLDWERKVKERIVYENDNFIALCPYASVTAFEIVIAPKMHSSCFEMLSDIERLHTANALRVSLRKLFKGLRNPDYNFFIHTSPCQRAEDYHYYHWHIIILPKTAVWAGFELGTGIEISSIRPEDAAAFLRKQK